MRITCPHCGLKKELEASKIPANVVRVVCPDCRQAFPLTREGELESTPPLAEGSPHLQPATAAPTETRAAAESDSTAPEGEKPACDETFATESVEPATITARSAALMIDTTLILAMVLTLKTGLSLLGNELPFAGEIVLNLTFMLFALILFFAYHTLFIGACGQTPGKMLMKIRVIQIDRSEMTYRRAMLREVFGKTLSAPFLLGYLMALFHPKRLAAHDKIADSCVVKVKTESPRD
jgi:predicted Zn finger-like uncharacterized protein